ncbi:MAG: PEGA domain-containing protein [Polyangia bacterium]
MNVGARLVGGRAAPAVLLGVALLIAPAAVETRSSSGAIKVTSEPPGAAVSLDGEMQGYTPLMVEATAGKHTLELRSDGHRSVRRYVRVKPQRMHQEHFRLDPQPGARAAERRPPPSNLRIYDLEATDPDAPPGTVTVATHPEGLTVFMDDYLIRQPTPVAFDIRPGIYELKIEQDGETVYRKTVFVRSGRTLEIETRIRNVRQIDYSDPWE